MSQGYAEAGLEMRLLTRSDFDGLVCAAILKGLRIVNEICYAHPKDVQDNKIKTTRACFKIVLA
jgi:hypothetical protein